MPSARLAVLALAGASMLLATRCAAPLPPVPPFQPVAEPPADSVESVLYLIGDAGDATAASSPVLLHLRRQVEHWSAALARDSSVVVIFLGDNVYPRGMHTAEHPLYLPDSLRLQSQIDVLGGPAARANATYGLFLAGNHDWGHMPGERGVRRVRNSEEFIDRARERGPDVRMVPPAGTTGPVIIEVGEHIDLLLFDTSGWLLESSEAEKARFFKSLDSVLVAHDHRELVIAAHHPYRSASAHAGQVPFWRTLGLHYVLARSGALIQDINSRPYRDLLGRMDAIFVQRGPPLVFAGGHDHALQVMGPIDPEEPRYILVSGAGSKTSEVANIQGMLLRAAQPGYMRIVVLRNGGMLLFVDAADNEFVRCTAADDVSRNRCLEEGTAGFRTIYSARMK